MNITREMVVRKQFSKEDCIKLIESIPGYTTDPHNENFDVWEQLLVTESLTQKTFTNSDLAPLKEK